MTADPNKKTARTFQCRDILWDAFQQMAQELECSVDYLINESMKQYARQRYAGRTGRADGAQQPPGWGIDPRASRTSPGLVKPPIPARSPSNLPPQAAPPASAMP